MRIVALLVLLFVYFALPAQPLQTSGDSLSFAKKQRLVIAGATVTYSSALVGLNELWYKQHRRSNFYFFDDSREWQQMDKLGHLYTCFEMGRAGVAVLQWSGLPDRKAQWLGSMAGLLLMTPVEMMDGFSRDYGASWSDLIANKAGAGLLLAQLLTWNELRIQPKFSFQSSGMAPFRPNTLGSTLSQQLLKDYNGQTYWLSVNPASFMKEQHWLPRWLNLSFGYSAENMLFSDAGMNRSIGHDTYRQYFLAFDVDFTRIKTNNKLLQKTFFLINGLHIPGPALSFDRKQGLHFKPFYY